MTESKLKHIHNWTDLHLVCARCGTDQSVKYDVYGKPYCTMCVLFAAKEELVNEVREMAKQEGR